MEYNPEYSAVLFMYSIITDGYSVVVMAGRYSAGILMYCVISEVFQSGSILLVFYLFHGYFGGISKYSGGILGVFHVMEYHGGIL